MKPETESSPFAILIDLMKEDGLIKQSEKLDFLLRKVTWTSGSEFQGEFGLEMKRLKQSSWDWMSKKTKASFLSVADIILKTWPEAGL